MAEGEAKSDCHLVVSAKGAHKPIALKPKRGVGGRIEDEWSGAVSC